MLEQLNEINRLLAESMNELHRIQMLDSHSPTSARIRDVIAKLAHAKDRIAL